jgi:hypothetical protein
MALKKFTNPKFLEQINRSHLVALVARYEPDFVTQKVKVPDAALDDEAYYAALAALAKGQAGLPGDFVETLYRLEAMANPYGKERLMAAVHMSGVVIEGIQNVTYADYAVQVFLADPLLFVQKHDESKIAALTSYEYFGCAEATDRTPTFKPSEEELSHLKGDIDAWLSEQREGDECVTQIDPFEVDGDYLFLIRRGDSYARVPTVEGGKVLVRHFRPARDLVVGYSPQRDEVRIHAKTGGERKMIRHTFGKRFFGNPDHFSVKEAFTLAPLRDEGRDALIVEPGGTIARVVLTEVEVRTNDEHNAVFIQRAVDLFALEAAGKGEAVPTYGELVVASFDVFFDGQEKPGKVTVRAGNRLKVSRNCDGGAVHKWLIAGGFRSPQEAPINRVGVLNATGVARN